MFLSSLCFDSCIYIFFTMALYTFMNEEILLYTCQVCFLTEIFFFYGWSLCVEMVIMC